jgi:hypothetical protein
VTFYGLHIVSIETNLNFLKTDEKEKINITDVEFGSPGNIPE